MNTFEPVENKVRFLASKLLTEPLYLSDEFREPQMIHKWISQILVNSEVNVLYELPDFGGVLGFLNIIPEHKADVFFRMWNKNIYTKNFSRDLKDTLRQTIEDYDLKRLSLAIPEEEKWLKFAKLYGFKREGSEKYSFRWNSKFYSLCRLRLLAKEV